MDLAVPQIWYGKVQAELTPTLITTREEKEGKCQSTCGQTGTQTITRETAGHSSWSLSS
jgi:hypothetical protein